MAPSTTEGGRIRAGLCGVPPAVPQDPEALSRRTTELVADLIEPAKADALETLGEGRQALGIANAWVRTKHAPKAAGGVGSVTGKGP